LTGNLIKLIEVLDKLIIIKVYVLNQGCFIHNLGDEIVIIKVVPSEERGYMDHGWLRTWHSFSFSSYFNPDHTQFGTLRVLNENIIKSSKGFDTHPHRDMEIVTLVLEGELEHLDSMGNHGLILTGDLQRISAGTGIRHSEYNPSPKNHVHLLQIWIFPKEKDIEPSYEQRAFKDRIDKDTLVKVVSGEKNDDIIHIHQDVSFYLGNLKAGTELNHKIQDDQKGIYAFLINGQVDITGHKLSGSDAAEITQAAQIPLKAIEDSYILLIETPISNSE